METSPVEPELLRHRRFLLRLAASLVGRNDAEDLVQDVWTRVLAAGGAPPVHARGWLARITRNLAVSRFRRDGRRAGLEREALDRQMSADSTPDLAETSAGFELGRRIAAAAQELEEPYRAVVLLRYFEGLDHATIAARLGVPIATVRTRQQRALARLRERLDRELGGREAWSAALGGWLARAWPAPAATIAAPVLVLGAVAATGALALLAWRGLPSPAAGSASSGAGPTLEGRVAMAEAVQGAARAPASAARERVGPAPRVTEENAPPRLLVVGSIAGLAPDELARTEVGVGEHRSEGVYAQELVARGVPDPDGTFTIDLAPLLGRQWSVPQRLVLTVDEPRHMPAERRLLVEDATTEPDGDVVHRADEVCLVPAAVLRGRIVLADGAPVAGASIEAFRMESELPLPHPRGVATSDADGRFVLRLGEAAPHALALLLEGFRPTTRVETVVPGEEHDLGTLRIERGDALRGTTRIAGVPQGGIGVMLHARQPIHLVRRAAGRWGSIGFVDGRFEWSNVSSASSEEGVFEISGLAPRGYRLWADLLPGTCGTLIRQPVETLVTAPAEGIELEFEGALVTLEVIPPLDAETSGRIDATWAHGGCRLDFHLFEDRVRFVAPAFTQLSIRLELGLGDAEELELYTPGPGEEIRRSVAPAPAPRAPD